MKFIKFFYIRLFLILALLLPSLALLAQDPEPEPFKFTWKLLIAVILGLWEVIGRLIPTVNDVTWLSWIIKLLSFLNEFLNRKKRR